MESVAAIENWRMQPGWRQHVTKIEELLIGFEPSTLELVAERG
jgi:hypothetical protein